MTWLQILVLALVQGVTEFLPISSSAHLILVPVLLGWQDQGLAFDVAVHVGSLIAVVGYFWRDVWSVSRGTLGWVGGRGMNPDARLGLLVVLGTIPAGLAGLLFNDWIEAYLRSPLVIAATTIGFGLLLWWADTRRGARAVEHMTWRDGLWIGVAQALALIPGTSRSGITMTAALMLGMQREAAARFSFLLAIPLIVLAGGLKTLELLALDGGVDWGAIAAGAVLSAASAYACIHLFLSAINRMGFAPFVAYRLVLGAVLLVLFVA
ncbi:MAG: undecaprenyl-diphosphate phosphatase [Abyssibacter sp.]|uniref:undecaprenyl-diphosphate phosphatase n=1 Tax=Abyssibacter sp. TaxID=2320200 RepID=UPI003219ADC0